MYISKKIVLLCGAFSLIAASLSGCANTAAVAADPQPVPTIYAPSEFQIEALANGLVDRAEYISGFENYQGCMAKGGFKVIVLDANSTIIDMRIPAAAVEIGIDDKCYKTEFIAIDEGWQEANQDQLPDNVLLETCLSKNGLPAEKTRQERVDSLLDAKVDLGTCLTE